MGKKQVSGNGGETEQVLLLRKQLEEAAERMELLRQYQLTKAAELDRAGKELEELNKLYKGYKRRRAF